MPFIVRHATEDDLEEVFRISRSLGDNRDPDKGFLVSNYSMETYQQFFDNSFHGKISSQVSFLIACTPDDTQPLGFLIAYSSKFILSTTLFGSATTEARLIERFGKEQDFTVIKQVAVTAEIIGDGVGSQLYHALFHTLTAREKSTFAPDAMDPALYSSVSDIFVAVIRLPKNERSNRFHASFGFLPVMSFGNEIGEEVLEREVLHVTAQTALQFKRDELSIDSEISGLRTSLENARELYIHEDNLNWTKLQYLSQYFAVIVAAQFVLPTLGQNIPSNWQTYVLFVSHISISVLLFYLLHSLSAKIQSGLRFMASHKRAVLITEAKLQHRTGAFYPAVSRVPRQSRTVILIRFARIIFGAVLLLSFGVNLAILTIH